MAPLRNGAGQAAGAAGALSSQSTSVLHCSCLPLPPDELRPGLSRECVQPSTVARAARAARGRAHATEVFVRTMYTVLEVQEMYLGTIVVYGSTTSGTQRVLREYE